MHLPAAGSRKKHWNILLVYVADEDQLDSLYLDIYPGYGNTEEGVAAPYVKVK